jgi:hypothetical protein
VRKIKEVLRLHYEKGHSTRQIAGSLDIGRSTVQDHLDRSERAGIDWPLASDLDETSLNSDFIPPPFALPKISVKCPLTP